MGETFEGGQMFWPPSDLLVVQPIGVQGDARNREVGYSSHAPLSPLGLVQK